MNIILLILDALRFDYVNNENTPNLMKLAKKGAWFNKALSGNSSTLVSLPYILCGQQNYDPDLNLATILNEAEYHTAMIHSNPMLHNFYSGFKEKIDLKSKKFRVSKNWKNTLRNNLPPQVIKGLKKVRAAIYDEDKYMPYARAYETLEFSKKWMKTHSKYFLWIHLMEPHIPYYPMNSKSNLTRQEIRTLNDKLIESVHGNYQPTIDEIELAKILYSEDIKEMDAELGSYFETFDTDDLLIITADHGEEFGEKGQFSHHEDKMIPELIHVPFIFYGKSVRPNTIIDELVSTTSVGQTILDALNIKATLSQSYSIWQWIKNDTIINHI